MDFRDRRKSVSLTQEEVAEHLGVGRTTVSMWETRESLPRTDMLRKLATLYGCTVDELLGDLTNKTQENADGAQEKEAV